MDTAVPFIDAYVKTVETPDQDTVSQFMMVLRLSRLLLILRLVKLLQNIKPVYTLVMGIAEGMQGMGWAVMLAVVWLYMGALCFVKLVGQGLVFGDDVPDDIKQLFPNVPSAMWVLFKVMNGDPNDLERLFALQPAFKFVVAVFMIISSWAILSIITAVVTDHMIVATAKLAAAEKKNANERTRAKLGMMFEDGDSNSDCKLTETEFFELLADDKLRVEEVSQAAKVDAVDMKDLFYVLSTAEANNTDGGKVSCIDKQDFVDGIMSYSEPVTQRAIFRLEKRLTTVMRDEARQSQAILADMMKQISLHFKAVTENLDRRLDGTNKTVTRVIDSVGAMAGDIDRINSQVAAVVKLQYKANQERQLLRCAVNSVAEMQNQANEERQLLRSAVEGIESMFKASAMQAIDDAWEYGTMKDCDSPGARMRQRGSQDQRFGAMRPASDMQASAAMPASRPDAHAGEHVGVLGVLPGPSTPSGPQRALGGSLSPTSSGDPAADPRAGHSSGEATAPHRAATMAGAYAAAQSNRGPSISKLHKGAQTPSASTTDDGASPLVSTPGGMTDAGMVTEPLGAHERDETFAANTPPSDETPCR